MCFGVCPGGRGVVPASLGLAEPGGSSRKTKRPRPYSHGTNRSNRFLPRETVQPQNSLRVQAWEWHGWAIESLSGSLARRSRAAIVAFPWVSFCLPSPHFFSPTTRCLEVSGTIHPCQAFRD